MKMVNMLNGMVMILQWKHWDLNYRVNKGAVRWILGYLGYISREWQHISQVAAGINLFISNTFFSIQSSKYLS